VAAGSVFILDRGVSGCRYFAYLTPAARLFIRVIEEIVNAEGGVALLGSHTTSPMNLAGSCAQCAEKVFEEF
jgi:hypothetical protein